MHTYTHVDGLTWATSHRFGEQTSFVVDVSSWETMMQSIQWELESGAQYVTFGMAVIWA
jgi:hypothetical protein